jgi:quinol monooxygenase YgiN
MTQESVILINMLKVDPSRQQELVATLRDNTETVIATLDGWKSTRLIASRDGASVTIYSEWETPEAVQAMRSDPRMIAYFPKIRDLASLESTLGDVVLDHRP